MCVNIYLSLTLETHHLTLTYITLHYIKSNYITHWTTKTGSAKMGFVHVKVGVCCGWGGGSRLVKLVGPSRAMDLLSSGRTVCSTEAIEMGLANHIVQSEHEALEYLASHTIGSARTIKALKSMVNSARFLSLEQALDVEGHLYASTWGKEEHLHALDQNMKHKQ